MGIVNGTFVYEGEPRNGATAKLWQAAGFGSPPALDADEPAGGYQQGSTITTGTAYGGDGAYRWTSVPAGEYYVSCYYQSHRVWQYYYVESITELLTTAGDLLVKGSSVLERLAKGSDGQILQMVSGAPAWATYTITLTVAKDVPYPGADYAFTLSTWTDVWADVSIPATAKQVIWWLVFQFTSAISMGMRCLYNGVEKATVSDNATAIALKWEGDGLGSVADLEWQGYSSAGTWTIKAIGGAWYAL